MRQASRWLPPRAAWSALTLLVVATAASVPVRIASADPPPAQTVTPANSRALTLYRESTKAYEEGRFKDAVDLLLKAYTLQDEPVMLFNLARAYEGLGDVPSAIDAYEHYLRRQPHTPDRKSIEQRLATLHKQEDDRVSLEHQRDEERARAEAAQRAAATERLRAEREEAHRHRPSAIPWIVAGVGVAGIGAGVVLGALSNHKSSEAQADVFRDPAQTDQSAAQTLATGANVAFVAGGIVAAAGAIWGAVDLLGSRASKKTDAPAKAHAMQLLVTPTSFAVLGRF